MDGIRGDVLRPPHQLQSNIIVCYYYFLFILFLFNFYFIFIFCLLFAEAKIFNLRVGVE